MIDKSKTVVLDVRDDLAKGREPFSKIMRTVSLVEPGQRLLLIAPFEPQPLFALLAARGFAYRSEETADGDFEVLFWRPEDEAAEDGNPLEVDARGLEPPQPLVKILEALAQLPKGRPLLARTDRKPMHLYDRLAQRGYVAETEQESDGSYLTRIRGAASGEKAGRQDSAGSR